MPPPPPPPPPFWPGIDWQFSRLWQFSRTWDGKTAKFRQTANRSQRDGHGGRVHIRSYPGQPASGPPLRPSLMRLFVHQVCHLSKESGYGVKQYRPDPAAGRQSLGQCWRLLDRRANEIPGRRVGQTSHQESDQPTSSSGVKWNVSTQL
jgi:hypothetical protein